MNPLYGLNQQQPQAPQQQGAGQVPTAPMGQAIPQQIPQQQGPQGGQRPQAQQGGAVWRELAKIIMGGE